MINPTLITIARLICALAVIVMLVLLLLPGHVVLAPGPLLQVLLVVVLAPAAALTAIKA